MTSPWKVILSRVINSYSLESTIIRGNHLNNDILGRAFASDANHKSKSYEIFYQIRNHLFKLTGIPSHTS